MRTRIVLPIVLLALTTGAVFLMAQEMPQVQIANWPAPASWEPPTPADATSGARGSIGTESALATTASSPLPFIAVTPCRIIDTRISGGAFGVGETRTYQMSGGTLPCVSGFPPFIGAVSLNITVTQTAGTGFLTGYPNGTSLPVAATLTWIGTNQTLTNAAVVPTGGGTTSSINIYASQATHVILDINGFYLGASAGNVNTFLGVNSGNSSMTGTRNTGIGAAALNLNTTGNFNTATGDNALAHNTTGASNTATGLQALDVNTTGSFNTGTGVNALFVNDVGGHNTAIGNESLFSNTSGNNNAAVGNFALRLNTTGSTNTAVGDSALINLGSGIGNVAVGAGACGANTSGNDNVCIHNAGVDGDSNTIRIGRAFHSATFIGGITGVTVTGAPVLVSSSGQLGVASSSRSVKDDIREIAEESDGLMRLRPVAFKYKPQIDPTGLTQYGLIAEEVAEVYPDLVVSDRNGKPQTVRYHLINALLLSEVQKQHRTVEAQEEKIDNQQAEIEKLKADLSALRALVSQR